MNHRMAAVVLAGMILLAGLSRSSGQDAPKPTLVDLLKGDEETAKETIRGLVARGTAAIPDLKKAVDDTDPLVRRRAKTAMGRITGQWGGDGRLVWKRSLAAAQEANPGKRPILLLQLFGKFDEEHC